MSLTREFRNNPQAGLQTYSKVFLPMKDFLEARINELKLKVDIDELFPLESAWNEICTESISALSRRRVRMKRKEAFDGHLKRPMSAFILFGNSVRAEIRKKNPEMSMPDVSREIGKMWRELKEKERAKFQALSDTDRDRFDKERKEAYEKAKAEGKLFKELKPKRALSSLAFYMKDEDVKTTLRAIFDQAKSNDANTNWLSIVKEEWDKLNDDDRAKYEKLAEEDKKRYEKETASYEKRFKNYKEEDLPDEEFEEEAQ